MEDSAKQPLADNLARGEPVLPIVLHLDGVKYNHSDSVLGIWIYNLLTERRTLCFAIRKATLCKCGCQSWCSMFEIWRLLNWSLESLHEGNIRQVATITRCGQLSIICANTWQAAT